MSDVTTKHCDYHDCKASIPEGVYHIHSCSSIAICSTVESARASTKEHSDFCSIACLTKSVKFAAKELSVDIAKPKCPADCPGRGPEADTCIDCDKNK